MPEQTPKRAAKQIEPAEPAKLWHAFLKPGRGQLVVGAVLCLAALLVVWTLRSQASQPDYSNLRRTDLIQLLDNLSAETRRLETEVRELTTTREGLVSGAAGAKAADDETRHRIDQLQIIAGTVPATGPGVRITIQDPRNAVTPELLVDALEELRDAGAEVIEFNDSVRVVANTWVDRDPEKQLTVDGTPLTAPIVIEAIGDPATLEAGVRFRGGLVSEVESSRVQGQVEIKQLTEISVDSIVTPRAPEFAKPN
jgi:hypothetical protein